MRNNVLRALLISLVAIWLLFCVSCTQQEPKDDASAQVTPSTTDPTSTQPTRSLEDRIAAQKRAVDASEVLNQYFYSNGWKSTELPDYYGGMYIEDDLLHVRLVNPSQQTMDFFKALFAGYSDVVVYEDAEYSRAMLLQYMDVLFVALHEKGCKITETSVGSSTGIIEIGALEEDLERVKQLVNHYQKILWGQNAPPVHVVKGVYSRLE